MRWMGVVVGLSACGPAAQTPAPARLDTLDLATRIAEKGAVTWEPERLPLDWMPTVWAYGLHRLHSTSGDDRWLKYNRDWLADALPEFETDPPRAFVSSDTTSPSVVAAALMADNPDLDFTPILDAAETYLDTVPTTDNGAVVHWGPDNPFGFPHDQVWVDSQFMVGVFWVQQFRRTADRTFAETFVDQYQAFSDLCRDPNTHLYFHAWDDEAKENIPVEAAFWARGNSWVLISAAEMLNELDPTDPLRQKLEPLFASHASAVADWQDPSTGLWRTILNAPRGDDPDNYVETSASALIAYAFARGLDAGALDTTTYGPILSQATHGVISMIDDDPQEGPVVTGTSFGTNPSTYEEYLAVVQIDDLILGVGAAVMLLSEAHGREDLQ